MILKCTSCMILQCTSVKSTWSFLNIGVSNKIIFRLNIDKKSACGQFQYMYLDVISYVWRSLFYFKMSHLIIKTTCTIMNRIIVVLVIPGLLLCCLCLIASKCATACSLLKLMLNRLCIVMIMLYEKMIIGGMFQCFMLLNLKAGMKLVNKFMCLV